MYVKFISEDDTIVKILKGDLNKYPDSYLTTMLEVPEIMNKEINAYPVPFIGIVLIAIANFYKKEKWICEISINYMNFYQTRKYLGLHYKPKEEERWRNYEYGAMFEIEDVC